MKKVITLAAAVAMATLALSSPAAARSNAQAPMTAEQHQQMMSAMADAESSASDPETRREIAKLAKRCDKLMAEMAQYASGDGHWAWRPAPSYGPRAPVRAPVRIWVPNKTKD